MPHRTIHPDGTATELSDDLATRTYTVATLAKRLEMSERRTYDLLRTGALDYVCCGAKAYRIGEPAVQRFLLGLKPLAA